MTHEKTLILETGRLVKVISRKLMTTTRSKLKIETEVLVKDPKETDFRLPIGLTHPKYWKLQKLDAQQARALQIQYSGVSEKQLKKCPGNWNKCLTAAPFQSPTSWFTDIGKTQPPFG